MIISRHWIVACKFNFVCAILQQQDRCLITDENLLYMMQEALQLRLSLVGIHLNLAACNNYV
jgi:hypothetical protein